jgi:hypothetical protein
MRVRTYLVVAAMLIVSTELGHAGPQAGRAGGDTPSVQVVRTIAEEGYIYGLPLAVVYCESGRCLEVPHDKSHR